VGATFGGFPHHGHFQLHFNCEF